jgi:glycine/D-amino acid oxidase-like deaminating enzyme
VWQKATGFDSEIVSPEDLQRIAPELNFLPIDGLLQRSHFELDSSTFTQSLASRAKQLGVNIFPKTLYESMEAVRALALQPRMAIFCPRARW